MGSECSEEEIEIYDPLDRCTVLSYGVGHMLNDMTSSCWFTYLLLFLTEIGLSPREASIVMLSGQVADALATVLAGELIDRYGKFKVWHGAGSILVAISFSSVFGGCILCKISGSNSKVTQTTGYSIFAAIFNIGWAAAQVSHMSMVNCVTKNSSSRVALASCRNAFTMVANLSLYAVALIVFSLIDATATDEIKKQYQWIAYLSITIGCCFVVVFLWGTKEPLYDRSNQHPNTITNNDDGKSKRIPWIYWFKKTLYYQVALVYMLTRLVTNVSQALLAFYVINDLGMAQTSKALIPGIIYICSFFVSVILQEMKWNGRRLKAFFTAGGVIWIFSGIGIFILPNKFHNLMYILSITTGVANALMMVTCISMEGILVGEDLNGTAFVYGSLSFLDKISCGIALYILESYQTSSSIDGCSDIRVCQSATRYGSGLIPLACALLGVLITFTMRLHDVRPMRNPLIEPLLV
ncbi:Major facilitator superfamily protein [Zostera marina]|uniref:Major facilitator superfamily protein n=1 Tax=Zostera marina TaxID=29655 RepID=A0A0K9P2A9_ZOSMR|nr:Major facilitator superfamily protein [Zostera marina]